MWQAGKHFQARGLQMSFPMHKHKSSHFSSKSFKWKSESDAKLKETRTARQERPFKFSVSAFDCPSKWTEIVPVMCSSSFIVTEIESDVLELSFLSFPERKKKQQPPISNSLSTSAPLHFQYR